MKLEKQLIFVMFVGGIVSTLGFFLAANQVSDWSLFSLGATLLAAALCSSLFGGVVKPMAALIPLRIQVKR